MTRRSDIELLSDYARDGSRQAFTELVARHRDWVHSVAVRRVRDEHLADDVTQAVFIVLARKARTLKDGTFLPAWLFGVARFAAAGAVRGESRRKRHEAAAAAMRRGEIMADESSAADETISGELDGAVAKLPGKDRTAVLLRFYQRKTLAEVGEALAISEDAARKRVDRAVDKLRARLAGGNATLSGITGTALTGWLDKHAVTIAQLQGNKLAAAAISAAHSAGATGPTITLAKGAIRMLIWNKIKWVAAICLLALLPVVVPRSLFRHAVPPDVIADQVQPAQTAPTAPAADGEIHYSPTLVLTVADVQASVDFYGKLGFVADNSRDSKSAVAQVKGGVVRISFVPGTTTDADRAARQKSRLILKLFAAPPGSPDPLVTLHDAAVTAGINATDIVPNDGQPQFTVVDPDGYMLVFQAQ